MRLIDADAFEIDMQHEWENNNISNGEWMDIREWLREAPTIDAEPIRHGKWLTEIWEYELEPEKAHYFKCSVCRKWGVVAYNEGIQKFKFCAFCGAKMEIELDRKIME